MVTKEYFLKNLDSFKRLSRNKKFDLINKKNTIFVSIPLIQITKLRIISYENMKKAFEMRFMDKLFSIHHNKKIVFSKYPYQLIITSLFGKLFLLKYLIEATFNKNNWDKLTLNKKYLEISFLKILIRKF